MTISEDRRTSVWHDLLERKISRRTVMVGTAAATAAAVAPIQLRLAQAAPTAQTASGIPFAPIGAQANDALVLAPGYSYNVVAHWGHDIGRGQVMGFNHDWTGFYPIDMLQKGVDLNAVNRGFLRSDLSSTDGLLVNNHEYVNSMFVSGYMDEGAKTPEQILAEQKAVGLSVIRVQRGANGQWSFVIDEQYNRSIDALTPMLMTGPAAGIDGGPQVIGTLANCSGGMTPWGTALSCEENFQDYPVASPEGYGWDPAVYGKRHYGWVVEVDPFDVNSTPRKHTAMGRFRHENVAMRVGADGTVVAYMGDDKSDACVYKFVADQKLTNPADRGANLGILENGKLYVADFGKGQWLLVDYDAQTDLQQAIGKDGQPLFTSQTDVLGDARAAALEIGGTPVDRPEDLEIHPLDGSVYIALTNNTGHGNFHGQIVRLAEDDDNVAGSTFSWSLFAVGGPQSGFSSPDNMIFDGEGNLWMVTDISTSSQNKGIYKFHGNNGMFFFRTSGPNAGVAYQFASGPMECELTGQAWTPDGKTMFCSVQHPGERSKSLAELTSNWPLGGNEIPRPAVVAITGF